MQVEVAEDRGVVDPAAQRRVPLGGLGGRRRDGLVARVADDALDPRPVRGPPEGGPAGVEHDDEALCRQPLHNAASHSLGAAGDDVRIALAEAMGPA